jgi:zinc-ribbon domain
MKVCSYCGHKNPDDQQFCGSCGTGLLSQPDPPKPVESQKPVRPASTPVASSLPGLLSAGFFKGAEPLDLSKIDMGFSIDGGFSWPDWKRIKEGIQASFEKDLWPQAWREVGIKWLAQLKEDLGGDYQQYESWNFLLLSAEKKEDSEAMLQIAEESAKAIESILNFTVPSRDLYGKRVIIAFNEDDDYYSYISHFYPEGHFSISSGMFIRKGGYAHVAFPFVGMQQVWPTLVHELTHNCMMGLRLPRWLNEGLTVRIEKALGRSIQVFGRFPDILDEKLAEAHHAFWNAQNIQEFWAGISFLKPGESNRLSYNLGEIMVELLSASWADFLNFVQNADPLDAGQDAALKCLNRCLGDTMGEFLGPGQWRPNRKAIAELRERK